MNIHAFFREYNYGDDGTHLIIWYKIYSNVWSDAFHEKQLNGQSKHLVVSLWQQNSRWADDGLLIQSYYN